MTRRGFAYHAMLNVLSALVILQAAPAQQTPVGQQPTLQTRQSGTKPSGRTNDPPAKNHGARDETILKMDTEVVTLDVTVTNKKNQPVIGLEAQRFEVYENEVKQKIEYFSNVDAPVSVGLVFDVSDSMRPRLSRAREALKAFIDTSHDNDDFCVVAFNHRPRLLGESVTGETATRLLSGIYAFGGTALYDAVYLGAEGVKRGVHKKRALLVISDGQDNSSFYTYRELQRLLQESDIQVYCIGVEDSTWGFIDAMDEQGRAMLEQLAKVTGGKAFFPRINRELEQAITSIALELRRQYSIGYIPSSFIRDGKWRKVKVRVNGPPSVIVRTRAGYYAKP